MLELINAQERLEREYDLNLITTAPSVVYRVNCVNGDTVISSQLFTLVLSSVPFHACTLANVLSDLMKVECSNPSFLPEPGQRKSIEEPYVKVSLFYSQQ